MQFKITNLNALINVQASKADTTCFNHKLRTTKQSPIPKKLKRTFLTGECLGTDPNTYTQLLYKERECESVAH